MRATTKTALVAFAAVALLLAMSGCGGGRTAVPGPPSGPQPPPAGTASIAGWVFDAQDTSTPLANVQVSVAPVDTVQTADLGPTKTATDGSFKLENLPAGEVDLLVQGSAGNYWPARFRLTLQNNVVTSAVIALIPQSVLVPTTLFIQPDEVTMDPGSLANFTSVMYSGSTLLNISPSWFVEGDIGTLLPNSPGTFSAAKTGQGKVVAAAGDQKAEAQVTVTSPQPPKIWSVFINPTEHPATGGTSVLTVHATDGDGIKQVTVDIYKPDGSRDIVTLTRATGIENNGKWVDATYTASYDFPRNTATPDPLGHQPDQTYDLRFHVKDTRNSSTTRNASTGQEWYEVVVHGLEAPPPPAS